MRKGKSIIRNVVFALMLIVLLCACNNANQEPPEEETKPVYVELNIPEEYHGSWYLREDDMPYEEMVSRVYIQDNDIYFMDLNFSLYHFLNQNSDKYSYEISSRNPYPYIITIRENGTPRSWELSLSDVDTYSSDGSSYFWWLYSDPTVYHVWYDLSTRDLDFPNSKT